MPKKEVSLKLKSLMLSVSPTATKYIKEAFKRIENKWNLKYTEKCAFFVRTEKIKEQIVINMIKTFIDKGYAERGYNIAYLCGMIENESKREEFKNERERKDLDRIPPKLKD
jgi:hypothetical protein